MFLSAWVSSIFIGLFFFLVGVILEPQNNWYTLAFFAAFIVSFIIIVFIGMPLVMLLHKYQILNWYTIILTSFFSGFMINLFLILFNNNHGATYISDTKTLISNGVMTIDGWINSLISCVQIGIIGLIAGIVFYATLKFINKNENKNKNKILSIKKS